VRNAIRPFAYVVSLLAVAAAFWGPAAALRADVVRTGAARAGGGGGGASLPVADTTAIVKGSADDTKLLRFEVDGFTTGTTRVLTPPNRDATLFGSGGDIDLSFNSSVAKISNGFGLADIILSNSGLLRLRGGASAGVTIETDSNNGGIPRANYVFAPKALTAAVATAFVEIAVPAGSVTGGTVEYTIRASDGTDHQARSGVLVYAAVNKAGVETCTLGRPDGGATVDNTTDILAQSSASTLTNTFTCVVGLVDVVRIAANAASGLVETSLEIAYQVTKNGGTGAITPQ
jgi:hypothetical protein